MPTLHNSVTIQSSYTQFVVKLYSSLSLLFFNYLKTNTYVLLCLYFGSKFGSIIQILKRLGNTLFFSAVYG